MQVFSNGKKLILFRDDNSVYTFDEVYVKNFNLCMKQNVVDWETFDGYREKVVSGPPFTEISLSLIGYNTEIKNVETSTNLINELMNGMKAEKEIRKIESLPIRKDLLRSLQF